MERFAFRSLLLLLLLLPQCVSCSRPQDWLVVADGTAHVQRLCMRCNDMHTKASLDSQLACAGAATGLMRLLEGTAIQLCTTCRLHLYSLRASQAL